MKNFFVNFKKIALCTTLSMCMILTTTTTHAKSSITPNRSNYTVTLKSLKNNNYTGDCTYIKVKSSSESHYVIIDAGTNASTGNAISKLKNTDVYNDAQKTYTINHFIFTHSHADHVNGVKYMTNKMAVDKTQIIIDNMYVNTVYMDIDGFKSTLTNFLANSNITVKNIHYFGSLGQKKEKIHNYTYWTSTLPKKHSSIKFHYVNSIKTVKLGNSGCEFGILPALRVFDDYTEDGGHNYMDINNSSMSIVLYDSVAPNNKCSFKAIFPGDLQANGLKAVMSNSTYRLYFSKYTGPTTYSKVYYKVSHHGKRSTKYNNSAVYHNDAFYNSELELMGKYTKPDYVIGTYWLSDLSQDIDYEHYSAMLKELKSVYGISPKSQNAF